MKKIVLIFALSLMLFSCGGSTVDLAIDNPTRRSVIVKVDTLTVEIPALEVVWVEMGKGKHTITLEDDSVTEFNFTEKAYMLNPTKNEYLKLEEFYGSAAYQYSYAHVIPNQSIEFYGIPFEGNYAVVKELINPISWDYGPREALPEMVETDGEYEVLVKLMDYYEFVEMLGQYQEYEEE